MGNKPKIAIIGGGASGMVAALSAAQAGGQVTLYESFPRLGKKLLATGNGRCNLSHKGFTVENFHSTHPYFVRHALSQYNEEDTLKYLNRLGIEIVEDERQRYYPASLQASAVLDVLRLSLSEAHVNVMENTRIMDIKTTEKGWCLFYKDGQQCVDAVVVATGGEAAAKLGGTRDGYKLLQTLGHQLIDTHPGIVQLVTDTTSIKAMVGLKRDVALSIYGKNGPIAKDEGELLITKYGISGPPVLQCSGRVSRALAKKEKVTAKINFFPTYAPEALVALLHERLAQHPTRTAETFFLGLLPRVLAEATLKSCGIAFKRVPTPAQLEKCASQLQAWSLPVLGTNGLENAQVTIGGIDTADFDDTTLGSWMAPGLFACGEVLDVDGDCGGYNLQWAWSSGRLAGESAVAYCKQ